MLSSTKKDKNCRNLVQKFEIKRLQALLLLHDLSLKELFSPYLQEKQNHSKLIQTCSNQKLLSLHASREASNLFTSIPRNSSKTRIKNRCIESGRSRSVLRFCKLSRIVLREKASKGALPGVRKASW